MPVVGKRPTLPTLWATGADWATRPPAQSAPRRSISATATTRRPLMLNCIAVGSSAKEIRAARHDSGADVSAH